MSNQEEKDELWQFIQDSTYVFVDPLHSSLGYVLAYLHNSEVTIDYASRIHKEMGFNLQKEEINKIFGEWERFGYAEKGPEGGYVATPFLKRALASIGATPENAHALAQLLKQ